MIVAELAPKAGEAESFLKALANRHRLMILCQLHGGELSVTALQEALGLSQSSLSQHLARLRADEVVKTRRSSQSIYYSISNPAVSSVMAVLYERFCQGSAATGGKVQAWQTEARLSEGPGQIGAFLNRVASQGPASVLLLAHSGLSGAKALINARQPPGDPAGRD